MLGLTQSYQAQQLGRLANEAGVAMAHASEGDNGGGHFRAFVEVTIFMFSYTVTIFVMLSYGICLTFYGCTQRVCRSCRRWPRSLIAWLVLTRTSVHMPLVRELLVHMAPPQAHVHRFTTVI